MRTRPDILSSAGNVSGSFDALSTPLWLALALVLGITVARGAARAETPAAPQRIAVEVATAARATLEARYGATEAARIERGVEQVRDYWRPEDGDADAFRAFVEAEFVPSGEQLDRTFEHFEFALERINGYFTSMSRDLSQYADLDLGPMLPLDYRLSAYNPAAHVPDDLFANKIAFVALLNFPLTTLQQRLAEGMSWSRRQWAEARLAESFSSRVPAEVSQRISLAMSTADSYINDYNIFLHHLVTNDGRRPFPPGLRLISHWGLRDELKSRYADPAGLEKQRMIQKVFDRIVRQEIPAAVVNNPLLDWNPMTNAVTVSAEHDADPPAGASANPSPEREPDTRYQRWLEIFQAMRAADPYFPDDPTYIDRRFNRNREIPETEVEAVFVELLEAPVGRAVGARIAERLGRPLEPFDIWYPGFRPGAGHDEAQLDQRVRSRYPTPEAFAADIPRILEQLGFSPERARLVADNVVVDPSRGAGHAFGAARRDDKAHLRTRVAAGGMDYKGYNIAVHELGHNVEQVFSMTTIDHTLLEGVPNTAFTEALAFVFQDRDLELLGVAQDDPLREHLQALETFWNAREIMGVALVDMRAWRWLYAHPEATPADFRQAVVDIAQDVWNRYYAEIFGHRNETLLAVYSHMVDSAMYTPDYPLGHLISFQIEEHFRTVNRPLGAEFERLARQGQLTPDAWMRQGLGGPLSPRPLIAAAERALAALPHTAAAGAGR